MLFILLSSLVHGSELCLGLFSGQSTLGKATEINHSNLQLDFHLVGEGAGPWQYIDKAPDKSNVLLKLTIAYDKDASYQITPTKGPTVSDTRLQSMFAVGLKEVLSIKSKEKLKGKRIAVFGDTAVTKHEGIGYMWMGVLIQFGDKLYQVRLQISLHEKSHIEKQKESVGIFGINLLHGLLRMKDPENASEQQNLIGALNDNLASGQIKINSMFIDEAIVRQRKIIALRPVLTNPQDVAKQLFKSDFARSVIIKNGRLIDPPSAVYKANVMVKRDAEGLSAKELKEIFDRESQSLKTSDFPNAEYVVPVEISATSEARVRELNAAGIAVWLFKPNGDKMENRVLSKKSYIELFFGRLHIF